MNHEHFTDEQIIAALKETFGKVYLAAERLGCHPTTIYQRSDKSPDVAQTLEHYTGRLIDIAEAALMKSVLDGEPWAIRLTLKTLGQKRGYTERPLKPPPGPRTKMTELVQEFIDADELLAASRQRRAQMTFTLGDPPVDYESMKRAVDAMGERVGRPKRGRSKSTSIDPEIPLAPAAPTEAESSEPVDEEPLSDSIFAKDGFQKSTTA